MEKIERERRYRADVWSALRCRALPKMEGQVDGDGWKKRFRIVLWQSGVRRWIEEQIKSYIECSGWVRIGYG